MASRPLRLLARILLWSLWLFLAATLAFQLRILSDGGLRLPAFASKQLARRLAAEGFTFQADAVWIDPQGRVLVIAPRIGLTAQDSPFASARAVSLQLRRRALLRGDFRITRAEFAGLDLSLPAILSPTGANQTLLSGGEFRLSLPEGSGTWSVDQASARVLGIPTAFSGALPASQPSAEPAPSPSESVRSALRQAALAYRALAALPIDAIRVLRAELSPGGLVLAAELPELVVPAYPALPPGLAGARLENAGLRLDLAFSAPFQPDLARTWLHLRADHFTSPPALALAGGPVALRLSPGPVLAADLALGKIQKTDTPVPPAPVVVSARFSPADSALSVFASTRLADAPWRLEFAGDSADFAGTARAAGPLTPALLDVVRHYLPEAARPILTLTDPIDIDLQADLAPGPVPELVIARLRAGRAVAHHVDFTRAGGVARYAPGRHTLRVDDLLLVQAGARALGSYEMDTKSLDYRFLLGGHLRPMAIEGWFSGWWDRFWANFAFGPNPPEAEVDIQGMWRDPARTTVYVGASSGPLRLRDLPLDAIATRIWVRTHYFDILNFRASSGTHSASGTFSRLLSADRASWRRMGFDVRAGFPDRALSQLFGKSGAAITAPFQLTAPPQIHLIGEVFGPASATDPNRQNYTLDLVADAPLHYNGFPLDSLSTRLRREGSEIRLDDLKVGFAAGLATGQAILSGPETDRWLAFDVTLANADLGLAQTRWREFKASRPTPSDAPPSSSEKAETMEETAPPTEPKPLGGQLNLHLAATGPMADPLAFTGRGTAGVDGADLAQIQLMGRLSSLLTDLGLGFSTVKLQQADARFSLDHNRLVFELLELSGPSALVTTKGTYTLSDGGLAFTAKVRPFERAGGILSSTADFVLSPLSSALEVELGGTLDQPSWIFSYGPSRILRRITDRF